MLTRNRNETKPQFAAEHDLVKQVDSKELTTQIVIQ